MRVGVASKRGWVYHPLHAILCRAVLCCMTTAAAAGASWLAYCRWIALGLAVVMLVASLLEALTVNVYFNILFRCVLLLLLWVWVAG